MSGGFSPSAQVRPTDAAEVLTAVLTKLRGDVEALRNESVCFITDIMDPSYEVNSNFYATVCFGDGQFDQGFSDGSGNLGVVESTSILVTVFSKIQVDRIERFQAGMLDSKRGLLVIKKQILKSLANKNLDGGTYNGNPSLLLLEPLYCRHAGHQQRRPVADQASFSLSFDAKFWWYLGEDSKLT